jgi:exonuclease-1
VMLSGWTDTEFRRMAIFSGCDYLKGLPQVGLKKAHGLVRKYKTPEKVVRMVMLEGKIRVPDNFLADFNQAELTFLHQRVYCPKKQELVCLTEPSVDSGVHDMPFIGAPVEPELARAIACGDVNPITKLPMVAIKTPDSAKRRHSQFAGMHAGPATAASNASVRPPMRPIESYFSPKDRRIPLGEMDTNCFSVDKQRLAALTENGRRSIVYPLPRPYIDEGRPTSRAQRRRTEPIANLLGDMGGVAAAAARLTATATTSTSSTAPFSGTTTGRPPKKARLCAETDDTAGVPPSTSKFFSKSKNTTSLQRRHTQNFPMSDDSLDEALAMVDLPDVDDWATGRSRVSMSVYQDVDIFTDRDGEGEDAGAVPADETANADLGVAGVEDDLAEESTADVHVEVPVSPPQPTLRRALTEFAYTPSTTRTPSTASAVSTARSSVLSRSSVSTWTPLSAATTPGSALRSLTPLQRIGQRALNRPRASSAAMTPAARRPAAPPLSDRARPRSVAVLLIPADPAFVPLPRVDMDEVEALNKGLGSEDLIIPASDDEEEEYGRATARVLDLGQFAYV